MSTPITLVIPLTADDIADAAEGLDNALRKGGHPMAGRIDLTESALETLMEEMHDVANDNGFGIYTSPDYVPGGIDILVTTNSDAEATIMKLAYPQAKSAPA